MLLGQDNFSLIYFMGDGGFLGYLVTHGILVLMFFLLLVVCLLRGWFSGDPIRVAAAWVIFFFILSLFFNRTLDYWPMSILLILFLNLSYHKRDQYQFTEKIYAQ